MIKTFLFIASIPSRFIALFTQALTLLAIVVSLMAIGSGLTFYFLQSHLDSVCFVNGKAKSVNEFIDRLTFWD